MNAMNTIENNMSDTMEGFPKEFTEGCLMRLGMRGICRVVG